VREVKHHLATVASGVLAATAFALSWAWAQGVVIAVGALCASLVAIVAAVRTLSGLRPVKWVWRALVADPASRKLRAEVREAIEGWWTADHGPGQRMAKLEAAADRLEANANE
jgi:hypothetical protein